MKQPVNRYISLVVGFLIMLLAGVYYAWSLFRVELIGTYFPDWTASATAMNFSLLVITLCLGGLAGGRLTARIGQPNVARIGAVIMLVGGFLFRRMESMPSSSAIIMLYISYGGLCGFGVGMVYNAVISSVSSRFPKAGGLASGTMLTGFGFGSLVTGALVMKLAAKAGIFPALFWCIVAVCVVSFFGSVCLRTEAPVKRSAEAPSANEGDLPTSKVARTSRFWLFFFWMIFMTSGGLMAINSAASIAVAFGAAAIIGMIVSVFNGVSRMGIGAFCDRFGSRVSLIVANVIGLASGVLLFLASLTGSTVLMVLGLVAAGVTYGCAMSLSAAVMREQFGNTHYASNFSLITLSGIPSSMLGPFVSGLLQDAFGGYKTTFLAMIVFSVVAAILLAGLINAIKKAGRG